MNEPTQETLINALLDAQPGDPEIRSLQVGAFTVGCVSQRLGLASLARPACPEHTQNPVQEAGRLLPAGARTLATRLFGGSYTFRGDVPSPLTPKKRGFSGLTPHHRASRRCRESRPHAAKRVFVPTNHLNGSGVSTLEASIAVAALNSLITPPLADCRELNAARLLAERGADRRVAVIGHFPFVDRLRQAARELSVFELPAGLRHGDRAAAELPDQLPEADVVAVTGTTLSNGTLASVLAHCRPAAYVVLIGASAPLSPVLFDFGIDAICGAHAPDPVPTLQALGQGATFRQLPGVQRLTLTRDCSRA